MTRLATTALLAVLAAPLALSEVGFARETHRAEGQRDRDDRSRGPRETETVDRALPMPPAGRSGSRLSLAT